MKVRVDLSKLFLTSEARVAGVFFARIGVGWDFDRSAQPEGARRVRILLNLFQRSRGPQTLSIEDAPLAIES